MNKRLKIQKETKKIHDKLKERKQERKLDYLKVEELKDGYLYRILARNAMYGIWLEDKGAFLISRFKFGDNYLFEEVHYDLSEHFGTARPLMEIEKIPFTKEMIKTIKYEVLEYLNEFNCL